MGIEPTIFRFEVGRLIHWATRPRSLDTNGAHLISQAIDFFVLRTRSTFRPEITRPDLSLIILHIVIVLVYPANVSLMPGNETLRYRQVDYNGR